MPEFIQNFYESANLFDFVFFVIMIYSIVQCSIKGFSLSFISFLKWIIALISTVFFVPKFQPWVSDYIESQFINSVGLGVFIFFITLFTTIVIGRSLGKAVTWTGLGSVDKSFGLIFGIFKGYIVSVCLFSILNWFYHYSNWGISAENAHTFNIVNKGSEILIKEFPDSKDLIDTKEKIEKI